MQSGVHAVIESRLFAQVSNFYPSLLQQTVEVTSQPSCERNNYGFISLAVQSSHDMNRHALGATGAERRNDMGYFNFFGHLSSSVGSEMFLASSTFTPRGVRSRSQNEKAILMKLAEEIVEIGKGPEHDAALAVSGPCCPLAPIACRRKTMSVCAFPKSGWIPQLPKPPDKQSTVAAVRPASLAVITPGHPARRNKE